MSIQFTADFAIIKTDGNIEDEEAEEKMKSPQELEPYIYFANFHFSINGSKSKLMIPMIAQGICPRVRLLNSLCMFDFGHCPVF